MSTAKVYPFPTFPPISHAEGENPFAPVQQVSAVPLISHADSKKAIEQMDRWQKMRELCQKCCCVWAKKQHEL